MKKLIYLIVLALILGLVLTGCSLLSNIGQAPANDQSEVSGLTKGDSNAECPAAPAVAGLLLEAAGVDNRYGTGKDGGNYIKEVANHMSPEADFNGVSKCEIICYECAVAAFLNNLVPSAGVTSQYACGILDAAASGATFLDNENRTGTMSLTVLNMCGGGIEGLQLADIVLDIQYLPDPTDLATLSAGGYWDIELSEIGNGIYQITFHRTGSVPYTRLWDVIVMDEIIEDDLPVAVTNIFEAELESVVYEGACDNTFGSGIGETLTLTFSNNVAIQYGDQVLAETYVYFDTATSLGHNLSYMLYTAEGNQVTITVTGTFGNPRPAVGDFVNGLNGIVDAIGYDAKVPVGGVEVIAKTYNYQWGPGYPYGATEAVYAAAIVSTCGMEVWWYSDGTLITEGWYYDEYSIQSISGWKSGNPANWNEPVKYLFGEHFPSIALAWYNRVSIDVGDVPTLEDATMITFQVIAPIGNMSGNCWVKRGQVSTFDITLFIPVPFSKMNQRQGQFWFSEKARLSLNCNGIFPIQLHSKSGFIFYNHFDSGTYYSTLEYESSSSTILS